MSKTQKESKLGREFKAKIFLSPVEAFFGILAKWAVIDDADIPKNLARIGQNWSFIHN